MKVSISSWNYRDVFKEGKMDILGFADDVKRLGADGFEIYRLHLNPDDQAADLKRVVERAAKLGLEISSLIAVNDFARPVAAQRAREVANMLECIDMAADLGIERLNTFTGYHTAGDDPFMEVWRVIDSYREVMPPAEKRNVVLCIENHSGVCRDADSILWLIKQVGSANLKTNPDFTNFVPEFTVRSAKAKEAIYTEGEKYMALAANVHLKVGNFTADGEHADVDMPRLMKIIRDAGYDGHIVLEAYGPNDPVESSAKGVELVKRYI